MNSAKILPFFFEALFGLLAARLLPFIVRKTFLKHYISDQLLGIGVGILFLYVVFVVIVMLAFIATTGFPISYL